MITITMSNLIKITISQNTLSQIYDSGNNATIDHGPWAMLWVAHGPVYLSDSVIIPGPWTIA